EQLRRKAKRAVEVVDVDRADRIEDRELTREEDAQRRLVEFWIGRPDEETGLVPFGGKTDPVTADMLRAVIDSKTSPRHRAQADQNDTGNTDAPVVNEPAMPHLNKAGEAFTQIVRHLPRNGYGNHGGVAATLVVTVDETTLRGDTD